MLNLQIKPAALNYTGVLRLKQSFILGQ